MSDVKLGSMRLDAAIEQVRSVGLGPLDEANLERFAPIQSGREASLGEVFRKPNLVDAMFDFIMPEVTDPSILRLNRSNALLAGVAEEVVGAASARAEPSNEGDAAMERLGAMVLKSELERFAALRERLGALIEA